MNLTFDDHITNPTPSPASECALWNKGAPPLNQMEGGTLVCRWGSGGVPNSGDWRKSLTLCLLCGLDNETTKDYTSFITISLGAKEFEFIIQNKKGKNLIKSLWFSLSANFDVIDPNINNLEDVAWIHRYGSSYSYLLYIHLCLKCSSAYLGDFFQKPLAIWQRFIPGGWILLRNPDKSLKSFPLCHSQSPL